MEQRGQYLYNLPDDLPLVKVVAFVRAYVGAYEALEDHASTPLPVQQLAAVKESLALEQMSIDGKHGTNDSTRFRQTVVDTYLQHYPKAYIDLQSGALRLAPELSASKRVEKFYQLAKDYYGIL